MKHRRKFDTYPRFNRLTVVFYWFPQMHFYCLRPVKLASRVSLLAPGAEQFHLFN